MDPSWLFHCLHRRPGQWTLRRSPLAFEASTLRRGRFHRVVLLEACPPLAAAAKENIQRNGAAARSERRFLYGKYGGGPKMELSQNGWMGDFMEKPSINL